MNQPREALEYCISKIYEEDFDGIDLEEMNRNLRHLCRQEKSFEMLLKSIITTKLKDSRKFLRQFKGSTYLEELSKKWDAHNNAIETIQGLVHHLVKSSIYPLGIELWKKMIGFRFRKYFFESIRKERSGEVVIDREVMSKMNNHMLMSVLGESVYENEFEKQLLLDSSAFYKEESESLVDSIDCGVYLKVAEKRLTEELDRYYLDAKSRKKIISVVEKEMIANHMQTLMQKNSGLVYMLRNDKYVDLGRMYNLFGRIHDGVVTLRDNVTLHLRETGKQLVTNPENSKDPVAFVQCLLNERTKYNRIFMIAFGNDLTFQKALNTSYEYFINLNPHIHEYMSLFVDDKLWKRIKGIIVLPHARSLVNHVMVLFRQLQDKYVFEKYYRKHLAKRLLLSGLRAIDVDEESRLIAKMEKNCGSNFTLNLQAMVNDVRISESLNNKFYEDLTPQEVARGPEFDCKVLTIPCWPTEPAVHCKLPAAASLLCDKFEDYYLGLHERRKFSWQTNMCTADIKAVFGNSEEHELKVSALQMCVLVLFNESDRLSYKEIEQATEIPASDLKRCLQSLACVKGKDVLRKEPTSKDIGEEDYFFVNDEFKNDSYKVEIGTVVVEKETEELKKQEIVKRVEEGRGHHMEAAIVRIMKSRKLLDHKELIAEVTKQLQPQFLVKPREIKKSIKSLIDRDFLERDSTNRERYHYLP